MTSFEDFAEVCRRIESISSSLEMTSVVAEFFRKVDDDELGIATHFIMGRIFPIWSEDEPGIGPGLLYSAISKISAIPVKRIEELVRDTGDPGKAAEKAITSRKTHMAFFSDGQLTISEVYSRFRTIAHLSGKGSQDSKIKNLQYLFSSAGPVETVYIARLAISELRIGVGEGIVRNAIAEAFNVPSDLIERGVLLTNDFGLVAFTAKKEGVRGLEKLGVILGRPVKAMLAQVTPGILEALGEMKTVAVEWKFDGARVQVHKKGSQITIYSRKLENVTSSLPDVVRSVRSNIIADSVILDGEVVALGKDNRPMAFQELLKRFRRKYDISSTAAEIPLIIDFFDIMFINGENLLDMPLSIRRKKLEEICDKGILAKQTITDDAAVIETVYKEALSAGHEGVMLKNPASLYSPGKRGKNWLKLKPVMETLDLVVIGGEWGEGRRANLIGSYLLACRDIEMDRFLSIGRVATGITDVQLEELTVMFKGLVTSESGIHLDFMPKIVFEVAFEEIQKSQNYDSGYALRFPRLVNVRSDKSVEDADSIERVEQVYIGQRGR